MSVPTSSGGNGPSEGARQRKDAFQAVDYSRVLVVGRSPINRVVVSKIAERAGLKPLSESPDTAETALQVFVPGTIVLDGGPDNRDCEGLLASIAATRRATGTKAPSVILLSNGNGTPESLELPGVIDIVVAKPITPERLQPVLGRLAGQGRH